MLLNIRIQTEHFQSDFLTITDKVKEAFSVTCSGVSCYKGNSQNFKAMGADSTIQCGMDLIT